MTIKVGYQFPPVTVEVTKEMIREYAHASADYNPLHLDEGWMATAQFGQTRYGGVIAHGLMTYSFATRMITDVVYPLGGWHERHESRFRKPVRPGDTLTVRGTVTHLKELGEEVLYSADVHVENQHGEIVIAGDAMGRLPREAAEV